jgi:hypothetical protein
LTEIRKSLQPGARLPIKDARAHAILSKIIQLPQIWWTTLPDGNLIADGWYTLKNFNVDFKASGPCFDGPNERDASFSMSNIEGRPIGTICFNAERLTRYLKSDFRDQFVALTLHEMTHAAGYGEEDAEYIQDYYLNRFNKQCSLGIYLQEGDNGAADSSIFLDLDFETYQPLIKVTYIRSIEQGPDVSPVFSNKVSIITYISAKDFSLQWTPKSGSLQFVMMNSDMTYTKQRIKWGASEPSSSDESEINSYKILSSNLRFDGKVLKPESVHSFDCALR